MDAEELIKQAADRVRAALDEAQRRAAEVVDEAEAQARRIRAEAEAEAKRIRAEAETATKRIRADAESQAQRRLEEVRTTLDDLQGRLRGAASAQPRAEDAVGAEVDPGPVTVPEPEPPVTPEPMPDPGEPAPEPVPEPTPVPVPEPTPPPGETDPPSAGPNGDSDSAVRLVAMKLCLDGAPRDEARKRLAAEYDVADLDSLLDEVYARASK